MSKFLIKFKRLVFSLLSISVIVISLWFSTYIGFNKNTGATHIVQSILMSLLVFILSLSIVLIIAMMLSGTTKRHTFLSGIVSLIQNRNVKYVYHDELGYFLISFCGDKIYGHKQGFMYINQIFDLYNDGDLERISKVIKENLDQIYYHKLEKERKSNDIKDKIDSMKKWDGYLDTKGRRDGKLNDLLGR